jgi:nitrate reductase gamma subunit
MRDNTSYLTIAVAAGLFTATMVGLSIASYTLLKKRASDKRIRTRSTENDNEKYKVK